MKKNKLNVIFSWRLILVVVLLILGSITFYKVLHPYYKLKDRTTEVEKFKGIKKEKALGWLRVQGTNIDFPIVYYHDSDISDPTNELGWSFVNKNTLQQKTTIFSHNILNVSSNPLIANKNHKRFEQLLSFIYLDFVKENKYIEYTTGGKNYLFKIYGVSFQKEEKLVYKKAKLSTKEMKDYINYTKENSYFDFDVDVNNKDKLITLVTCTRFFGQTTDYSFVVDARMVRDNEIISNYKVKEKKNYQRIKKLMKGDADNV